jgi:sec-independent protein translocase protein TatC
MSPAIPRTSSAGTEQPFVSHLIELRDRLVRALIASAWPLPAVRLARPIGSVRPAGRAHGGAPAGGHQADRHQRHLAYSGAAEDHLMAAFLLVLPYVLYQVWAFVAPGLYSHEKKFVLPLVVQHLLFFIGVAFCYFLVIPAMSQVHPGLRAHGITAAPDIEQYFGFVLTLFMVFGIAFEVPVAVVVLVRIGRGHDRAAEARRAATSSSAPSSSRRS